MTGKHRIWYITAGCFLSYFLFGFIDNLKGPVLPALLADADFNYSDGGTIVFSEYTGFFAATFLAGLLSDLFGKKFTLILSGICLIFGVVGYASSSSLIFFIVFIFFIGLGLGSLELSGSNIISGVHVKNSGRYLNLLNAFYGAGSVLTPVLAGILLNSGISWRAVYRYSLMVIIPVTLYFMTMRLPREEMKHKPAEKSGFRDIIQTVSRKEVILMYIVIFAYVAAEICMATWMVEFLQISKHISAAGSSIYFSVYFACMTAGRLLGSLFVDRIGHVKSLLIFSSMAALCLAFGIFGPQTAAFFLVLTGFCFSIIFPTATAVVTGYSSGSSGTLLGLFFAFGGLGGMTGPWLTGIMNDLLGLKWGMSVNIIFCAVIMITLIILRRIKPSADK